jgi:hypothetical protein
MRKLIIILFLALLFAAIPASAVQYSTVYSDNFEDGSLDAVYTSGYTGASGGSNTETGGKLILDPYKSAANTRYVKFNQTGNYFTTDVYIEHPAYTTISLANHSASTIVGDQWLGHLSNAYLIHFNTNQIKVYSSGTTSTLTTLNTTTIPATNNTDIKVTAYYDSGIIHIGTNTTAADIQIADSSFGGFQGFMLSSGDAATTWTKSSYDNLLIGDLNYTPVITPAEVSPVSSYELAEKSFPVTSDRTANISWYLNGSYIQTDNDTTSSTYTNSSGVQGNYNLTAFATNEYGTGSYTWNWAVNERPPIQPVITATPMGNPTAYENIPLNFEVDITNTKGTFAWTLDGTPLTSTDTPISSTCTLPAQEKGTYNLTCTVTNTAGTASKSWNVEYVANSMNLDVLYFNETPAANGTEFIFNVSNFTEGIPGHGWSPQDFNHTIAGRKYSWIYENGSVIDTKTATSDGEALDFAVSDVPEGIYKIGITPTAGFSAYPLTGVNSSVTHFIDNSSYTDSRAWDFENDGLIDSTDTNPEHAYTLAGTYTVNLTVYNEYGNNSKVISDHIYISPNGGVDPLAWFYWWMRSHIRW